MVKSWQKLNGQNYYFNASGVMQTEWQMIGGKLYYFGYDGAMQKNKEVFCYYDSEHWGNYYLQSDGSGISVVCYRLNQATLKPHYSFVVYNRQTKNHSQWTTYISDKDKQILQNFINKNFKKGMTREQQLWTTLNWIHTNVEILPTCRTAPGRRSPTSPMWTPSSPTARDSASSIMRRSHP